MAVREQFINYLLSSIKVSTQIKIFDVISSQKKSKTLQKLAWGSQRIPKRKAPEEPEDANQDPSGGTPDQRSDDDQHSEDTEEGRKRLRTRTFSAG